MSRLKQLRKTAGVLLAPGGVKAMRTWKPFSLTAFHMMRRLRSEPVEFRTVIDGGANAGQFSRAALETFPGVRLVAFEPLPEVAATLRKNLAGTDATIIETALGAESGTLEFHRNAYSLSSSALPLHDNHKEAFPDAQEQETIQVPVARLDDLLDPAGLVAPSLLKLDLQGYEIPALDGAPELLKHIDYLLVETAFRPLYEGEALFPELHAYLQARGFRFLRPLDVLEDPAGAIVQMDALFVRNGSRYAPMF
ncbi:MAG: FkbM family methyltransferase [Rhodothermales bacterium]|nr:FkbM family methyltransferase [Rhodothermales bacterium]MBO6781091.1 FkbM family methyltransferase [Rhodothermales bacterium]